ncbi:MAG TPA: prepilin peptidase [Gemmatimonadales bacterium]|nr:prepilin peptidase [Gemmatimonadales bacterium]
MWSDAGLPGWVFVAWFALLGAALGSFLNVCILRWGAEPKQSVMHPPSRCPACGHAIRWYENIPIVSWLVLRGRCSGCGTPISPMYPAIETATALIWGGAVALLGPSPSAIQLAVASTLLLGVAVSDARAFIIPHEFSLGGTVLALAFAAWPDPAGLVDALGGALFGAGLVLLVGELSELVLGQEAMGGGDCALMGMVGAFFGWESVWPVLALGAFVGIVLHVAASLRHRAPARPSAGDEPRDLSVDHEPIHPEAPALRWGRLFALIAAGLALVGLMGVAVRVGVIGGVLTGMFHGILGAGAAYYLSFVVPQRLLHGPIAQVWGLLGAAAGLAIGSGHWTGLLIGLALGASAVAWARQRTVEASPASTEELSAHGYLPFGVGLSIAAIVLGFTGGFQRVREVFAEIAPGLGL